MIRIPTFQISSADFEQDINLNDQIVNIRITYNIRDEYFFLIFTDQDGNVVSNIKIVPNWLLLNQHKALLTFDGDLIVSKTDEEAGDVITYDNFGSGWDLFCLTEQETRDWKKENGV